MRTKSKKAFTFIEVLVSVILLFIGLLALLKFDGFIKKDIEKSIKKHKVLMLSSAFNYSEDTRDSSLDKIFSFSNLRDDERELLKNTKVEIKRLKNEDFLIYDTGDKEYKIKVETMRYGVEDTNLIFYRVSE